MRSCRGKAATSSSGRAVRSCRAKNSRSAQEKDENKEPILVISHEMQMEEEDEEEKSSRGVRIVVVSDKSQDEDTDDGGMASKNDSKPDMDVQKTDRDSASHDDSVIVLSDENSTPCKDIKIKAGSRSSPKCATPDTVVRTIAHHKPHPQNDTCNNFEVANESITNEASVISHKLSASQQLPPSAKKAEPPSSARRRSSRRLSAQRRRVSGTKLSSSRRRSSLLQQKLNASASEQRAQPGSLLASMKQKLMNVSMASQVSRYIGSR